MAESLTLDQAAIETTYEDLHRMICDLTWRLCQKTGCDFEEAKSAAHEGFMLAYRRYNPNRGCSFSSYCYRWVWGRLVDWYRSEWRQKRTRVKDPVKLQQFPTTEPFYLRLEKYGDAKEVVVALFSAPTEIMEAMNSGGRLQRQNAAWSYLEALGWTADAITKAFAEIRELVR